ncbi:MAG: hypothetical protein R3F65_30625 [bacterium]
MTHALTLGGRDIALELHQLLRDFDPAAFRGELATALRERLAGLSARIVELLEAAPHDRTLHTLRARLDDLKHCIDQQAGRLADRRAAWRKAHRRLQMSYQQLAEGLRAYEVHVPALRPTNYLRNVFHAGAGVFAMLCIELVLSPTQMLWVAGAVFAYAWSMELGRRVWPGLNDRLMRFYGKIAHPHEWHRVNSATWYTTALLLLALTGSPLLCAIAVTVLGFADPAAALVGRRFGRTKLVHGRSLEGTLTFFAVGFAAAFGIGVGFHGLGAGLAALGAAGGAGVAAFAELYSRRVDDNLTIPLAAAAGAWAAFALAGVPIA